MKIESVNSYIAVQDTMISVCGNVRGWNSADWLALESQSLQNELLRTQWKDRL